MMLMRLRILIFATFASFASAHWPHNPITQCSGCNNPSYKYQCHGSTYRDCRCQPDWSWDPYVGCNNNCCRPVQSCCQSYSSQYTCDWIGRSCTCSGGFLGYGYACFNAASCCPGLNGRRVLQETGDYVFDGSEEAFQAMPEACAASDFETFLYIVDGHFYGVTVPLPTESAECFSMAGHVQFGEETGNAHPKKEVLAWSDSKAFDEFFDRNKALLVGTFSGRQLSDVFASSETRSGRNLRYDALMNNCADFLLNMARSLDVPVDSRVASYVSRRLVEDAGSELVQAIRDSPVFRRLRGEESDDELVFMLDSMSDEDAVGMFVQARADGIS